MKIKYKITLGQIIIIEVTMIKISVLYYIVLYLLLYLSLYLELFYILFSNLKKWIDTKYHINSSFWISLNISVIHIKYIIKYII